MSQDQLQRLRELVPHFRVPPGSPRRATSDFKPGSTPGIPDEEHAAELLKSGVALLSEYQAKLAAQDVFGVVLVLQGMDASGKDGTITHVMRGVNPQGVTVHSFKKPSLEELDHDYLWRYARALPRRGEVAIFNRSHYEEVLVVRVHPDLLQRQHLPAAGRDKTVWERRYREINDWEQYLVANGFVIVKVFLNVSKAEQRRRLLDRLEQPDRNWKISPDDIGERRHWNDYQRAYGDVLASTSTEAAPWFVVPADHKWFTRVAVAAILVDALARIDPKYPESDALTKRELAKARAELESED